METVFLIVVIVLLLLALVDLNVGVSNDAVNFLSSAVGAKAASMKVIFLVASLGILFGAISSNGMMEISRNGVLHPQYFTASEVLTIFLSVMIADIVLLNIFNFMGMPTSTTVSMVFELIGGATAMAIVKTGMDGSDVPFAALLNTDKALTMILGIFLSVAIAFVFGIVVQHLARLLFTFNYKKNLKWKIGVFGGLSITTIIYFVLIKGLGAAAFMTPAVSGWIKSHTILLLTCSFVLCTLLSQILYFLKVNVFKVIIMVGTFALAMAFAGNDLVNFIGIPLAGISTYQDFARNATVPIDQYTMDALNAPAGTPVYVLVIAGAVMVFSLITSKKSKKVLQTSIGLSSQDTNTEMFGSSAVARVIVRKSLASANTLRRILPERFKNWLHQRFDTSMCDPGESAAFDLVRGSVNIVLAGLLIALGTSLKLPLSTTYVAFMVAMGSSLADKAWGRDSAVYRVTGVFSVIGGWLFTALAAFLLSFIITLVCHFGGVVAMVLVICLAAFVFVKMLSDKKTEPEDSLLETLRNCTDEEAYSDIVLGHIRQSISGLIEFSRTAFTKTIDGFIKEDIIALRQVIADSKDRKIKMKILKRKEIKAMQMSKNKRMMRVNTWFHLSYNCVEEILYSLRRICEPVKEHIDNSFTPLEQKYFAELEEVKTKVLFSMDETIDVIKTGDYAGLDELRGILKERKDYILAIRDRQMKRVQQGSDNLNVALLYLNIIQEAQELINELRHLLRDMSKMQE